MGDQFQSSIMSPNSTMPAVKATSIPHLARSPGISTSQLIVKGKPFLILGAELQNSSMTSAEYMETVWPDLVKTHVNTVLGCVTWEMIEPVEDQFDFTVLDAVIIGARQHGLHLILLWFGSFKNGQSTYVPSWVKTNPKRFPRAKLRKAHGLLQDTEVLSLFHSEGCKADAKAFTNLMKHLKQVDETSSTVIMVQVENEVGLLGDSRDGSLAANMAFAQPVPQELVTFLIENWGALNPDLRDNLGGLDLKTRSGSWEEYFGKGLIADELFMAYHYSLYVNAVATAGKAAYALPMYTNVWQNYDDCHGASATTTAGGGHCPGEYPSGGATSNVLDIWQHCAPSLDFISPDIYLNDYAATCAKYRHNDQPLFIPEQRRDAFGARRVWIALGSYAALGTSPFGIDTLTPATNPFTKHYALLDSVSAIVLEAQRHAGSSVGFCFDEVSGARDSSTIVRCWGGYKITIERCFVFGRPAPAAGMVIYRGGATFLLIGWGFQVRAKSTTAGSPFTGILRFEEKTVANRETGELKTLRMLNGDETRSGYCAMMPSEDPDYGDFPICVTIPARTMIAELELYSLDETYGV